MIPSLRTAGQVYRALKGTRSRHDRGQRHLRVWQLLTSHQARSSGARSKPGLPDAQRGEAQQDAFCEDVAANWGKKSSRWENLT